MLNSLYKELENEILNGAIEAMEDDEFDFEVAIEEMTDAKVVDMDGKATAEVELDDEDADDEDMDNTDDIDDALEAFTKKTRSEKYKTGFGNKVVDQFKHDYDEYVEKLPRTKALSEKSKTSIIDAHKTLIEKKVASMIAKVEKDPKLTDEEKAELIEYFNAKVPAMEAFYKTLDFTAAIEEVLNSSLSESDVNAILTEVEDDTLDEDGEEPIDNSEVEVVDDADIVIEGYMDDITDILDNL